MRKIIFLVAVGVLSASCVVRRPVMAPHRSDTPEHRRATTYQECLACHAETMPHSKERGDCLKCHRILLGG